MTFDQLINTLEGIHQQLSARASQQVNTAMTIRNWLIGYYLVEFEQNGEDLAAYGQHLMERTAKRLTTIKGMAVSTLFNFRQFYITYGWFADYILDNTTSLSISQTTSGKLFTKIAGATGKDDKLRLQPENY